MKHLIFLIMPLLVGCLELASPVEPVVPDTPYRDSTFIGIGSTIWHVDSMRVDSSVTTLFGHGTIVKLKFQFSDTLPGIYQMNGSSLATAYYEKDNGIIGMRDESDSGTVTVKSHHPFSANLDFYVAHGSYHVHYQGSVVESTKK